MYLVPLGCIMRKIGHIPRTKRWRGLGGDTATKKGICLRVFNIKKGHLGHPRLQELYAAG